ncbi:hypothetical protein K7432_008098 [Basidiobolus ranarum]|uniref:Cardiolipin synthase n=1 Tax=Basidiobolus ranarum TaxID=34480 RepID=A0ABR2VZ49_9FUNG
MFRVLCHKPLIEARSLSIAKQVCLKTKQIHLRNHSTQLASFKWVSKSLSLPQLSQKSIFAKAGCSYLLSSSRSYTNMSSNTDKEDTPSKSNDNPLFKKLKEIPLKEEVFNIPNVLTLSRLAASPFIGYLIYQQQYTVALIGFAIAGFTDMLDGYIARKWNMKTFVGSIIDPMADKTLMTILTVTLASQNLIPMPLAVIILGRDIGLVISSFYYRYISLPPPKTLTRYFDFTLPSAEVRPTQISKVNTALQLLLMGSSLAGPVFGFSESIALTALQYTVGATTILSGASYVYSKDAVRILHQQKKE